MPARTAPVNIRSTSTEVAAIGQRAKSVVENPAVVMIEATWKSVCLNASSVEYASVYAFVRVRRVVKITATAAMRLMK